MYSLAMILGLNGSKKRKFDHAVMELEQKINSNKSLSAEFMAEIYQKSNWLVRELGFSPGDILANEAFMALKNRLRGEQILAETEEISVFWQKTRSSVIVCADGLVSANLADVQASVEENLTAGQRIFTSFRLEARQELAKKFAQEIPQLSEEKINEKLF